VVSTKEDILQNLTPEQKEAVIHDRGPLLIVAGAGTGKTRVITRRIAHLIATKKARPEEILALTFSDKAAGEMEERVDLLVPYGYTETWISTFHAFGDRVLRDNALEIGLVTDFRVLTRPEQIIFFRDHLFEFPLKYFCPLGSPTKYVESILSLISRAKDEDVTPADYLKYVRKLKKELKADPKNKELKEETTRQEEIALCYQRYEELKAKEGFMDFGDQIVLTLKLFRQHSSVLKKYKDQFRYILVDEFQDTNYAQFELVKLLAEDRQNITVVGDDDQSIYKFRGAAISNILNFKKYYPKCKQIVLVKNYRSPQILLDTAYRLITNNNPDRLEVKNKIDKRLVAVFPQGQAVTHLPYDSVSTEADKVAQLIKEKVAKGDWQYHDVAILVRANDDADPFLRALNVENIDWKFTGGQGLYDQTEIKLLLNFLRVVANPEDSPSLFFLATSEIYNLTAVDIAILNHYANRKKRSLHWVLKNLSNMPEEKEQLTPDALPAIDKILTDLENYCKLGLNVPTGELLYRFLHDSGYLEGLTKEENLRNEEKIKNIAKFFNIIKNTSTLLKYDRVNQFVQYLDMLISAGDDPTTAEIETQANCVNVLTVHKAKGLEFPVVIMVSLVSDRFPTRSHSENLPLPDSLIKDILPAGNFHLQEERRLFYVGMTRAKKELYFTSAEDYGGKRLKKISLFVVEALGLSKEEITPYKRKPIDTIVAHAPRPEAESHPLEPMTDEEVLNLTPYHVDDYLTCPLKYKYIHILRVPILSNHNIVYGSILHKVVEEYYKRKMNKVKVSWEDIKEIYEANWTSEGFLSRTHEEQRQEEGLQVLKVFYQRQEKEKNIPTHVEKDFKFMLGTNKVAGRWDRVDVRGEEVVIIDYKTSDVRDQDKADEKAEKNLQLAIYALASKNVLGKLPDWLELYFLESGLVGKCVKTEEDLASTIEKINQAASGIRRRDYHPIPSDYACGYCTYNKICPAAATKPRL
jgi:DNA helicase II / ATP-dependent DNA helicase PcrA